MSLVNVSWSKLRCMAQPAGQDRAMACGIQIHILTSARKISFYLRRATLERLLHFGILDFYISWQLCSRVSQVQVAACILELFFSLPPDTKNLCERKTDALFQPIRKKVRCYH